MCYSIRLISLNISSTFTMFDSVNKIHNTTISSSNLFFEEDIFEIFNVTIYNLLALLNGLNVDDYIYPNTTILVPKKDVKYYITKDNDTLSSVNRLLQSNINNLLKQNNNIYLKEGQLIVYKD